MEVQIKNQVAYFYGNIIINFKSNTESSSVSDDAFTPWGIAIEPLLLGTRKHRTYM